MIDPIEIAGRHFSRIKAVSAAVVEIRAEVRKLCAQNACGKYGQNWTCPPALQSLDHYKAQLGAFDRLLILVEIYPVKDSFDWKAMTAAAKQFKDTLQVLKKEIESTDAGFPFLLLGAGACHLCEPCNYVNKKPCRHPDDAIVSLEACGIDVMRLLKQSDMQYYHGKGTVTFVGGLFYDR